MAKVELDIKINPKLDKGAFKQQISTIEADVDDINIGIHIDAKDAANAVADVIDAYQELEEAMADAINVDINTQEGEEALDRLNKAIRDIEDADFNMNDLANEFAKTKKEVDELATKQKQALAQMKLTGQEGSASYKKLQDEIDDTEKKIQEMSDAMGDLADVQEPEGFMNFMAKFEALGNLGESMKGFAESGLEMQNAMLEVQAATGATNEEMVKLKENAIDAFKSGVGESVADAVKIMGKGKQLLGDFFDDTELTKFVKSAQGIANVFDKDVNEVIAGSRTFIAQFGLDGQRAADLVALSMQNVASKMDDVLDTLDEYSQLAVKAGYSAEQMTGLISLGMEKGVRDTDKLLDSVKETQIRLSAGDTTRALGDISAPIARTIQGIVRLGETGAKSVRQVTVESAAAIDKAFQGGEITAAVRDQLTVAISGTMAEDIGGELWTKVFSAEIDETAIRAQAAQAGALVNQSLGPITFVDKIQKELEAFAATAGEAFAGIAQAGGTALTTVSQVAPGLTLIGASAGPIKDVAKSILTRLAPSLMSAAAAQGGLNLAMSAMPIIGIIAGVAALAAGVYFLADALHVSTEEGIENAKADDEVIKKQIALNEQQISSVKNGQYLIDSFKKQGEAARDNGDLMIKLARTYPGVIDKSKSYKENLSALEGQTKKNNKELNELDDELTSLANRTIEIKVRVAKLEFKKISEELEDDLFSYDWSKIFTGGGRGGLVSGVMVGFQDKEVKEALLKPLFNAIKTAKNDKQLQKASVDLQMAIYDSGRFGSDEQTALTAEVEKMTEAKRKLLEAGNGKLKRYYETWLAQGIDEDHIIKNLAKKFSLTEAEAAKQVADLKAKAAADAEKIKNQTDETKKSTDLATKSAVDLKSMYTQLLDSKLRALEVDKEKADIDREIAITQRGMGATIYDEIIAQEAALKLLRDKLIVLKESKGADSAEIKNRIENINTEIEKGEKTLHKLSITATFDKVKLAQELKEIKLSNEKSAIEYKISLGLADESALAPIYEKQLQILADKRADIQKKFNKADDANKLDLLKQLETLKSEEIGIEVATNDAKIALIDRQFDKEKATLDRQSALLQIQADKQRDIWEGIFASVEDASVTAIENATNNKLDAMDKAQERELDYFAGTEAQKKALQEQFESEKAKAQEDAEKRKLAVQQQVAGARFALENEQILKSMDLQKKALELELESAKKKGDNTAVLRLQQQLEDSEKVITEKGDKVRQAFELMSEGVDDVIGNLFAGNTEAMKQNMRDILSSLVGYIKNLVTTWVWEQVLTSPFYKALSLAAGPAAPLVTAGGAAILSQLINAVLSPLLNTILSFPTGGVFDSPTLAVIGDGARLGGENTEILLRSDQLQKLMNSTIEKNNKVMAGYFANLVDAVSQQRVVGLLQGADMLLLMQRAQSEENRRNV